MPLSRQQLSIRKRDLFDGPWSAQHESASAFTLDIIDVGPIATPATKPKGGQFVLHAQALHGTPYDGHTLGPVVAELEALTGFTTRHIHVDKGYRGHNHRRSSASG